MISEYRNWHKLVYRIYRSSVGIDIMHRICLFINSANRHWPSQSYMWFTENRCRRNACWYVTRSSKWPSTSAELYAIMLAVHAPSRVHPFFVGTWTLRMLFELVGIRPITACQAHARRFTCLAYFYHSQTRLHVDTRINTDVRLMMGAFKLKYLN